MRFPLLLLTLPLPALAAAAPLPAFLEEHCTRCHGPDKSKGDLRVDTLGDPAAVGEEASTWAAILDVLENGDMPPRKEQERPGPGAVREAVSQISAALAQSTEPPIGLRRLNRTEYEYTVHDLLGIDTPLRELLPEDGSVQGFDNVADGLGISSVLMERYLEAADAAFEGTIRRIEPLPAETRRCEVMERKENRESAAKNKGGVIEVEGAMVKFTPGWPPVRIDEAHPIEDGIYRGRIAVWPYQPGGRTMAVAIYAGPLFGSGKRRFQGVFDVTGTPENPRIIECEAFLREGETLHIVPWVYPEHVTWRDKHEKRPGIGVAWAETHGPLDQEFPSKATRALFGDSETITMVEGWPHWMRHRKNVKKQNVDSTSPEADIERILRELVPRAFRRPVDPAVADPFVALALELHARGRTFEQAVRAGVDAILCAPQFLLLNREEEPDGYTLASRLSYFLWSSMPDEELLGLAAEGKLSDPAVRHAQVERMLADGKAERFVDSFTGQWLDLREIEFTTPDKKLYPEFDPLLQESMLRETRGFFRHLLEEDLGIANLIDSDFGVLNERLAKHYGIEEVKGHEHSRVVRLPEKSIRGGVMTHASLLKVTANGTTSSPVLRGVWILDNLMGRPVPPPPPGLPGIEPDIRGATTIREQLAKHSEVGTCARCHARIDPPGFALECFDPIGGERTWYRSLGEGERPTPKATYTIGPGVENHGETQDGKAFADFREFRAHLSEQPEEIARALAGKLLVYGSGRPLTPADRASVESVVETSRKSDFGLRSMIHSVVETEMFQRR